MTFSTWIATALALGAVHAALALAVVAVTQVTRTLHLAIGPVVVASGSVQVAAHVLGAPPLVAVLAGMAAGVAVSVAVVTVTTPARAGTTARTVGLLVAGGVVELAVARLFGGATRRLPPLVGDDPVLAAALLGLPVAATLAVLLRWTRWGRRVRLVGGSPAAAERIGVSPTRVVVGAAAVAGLVAGATAALVGPVAFLGVGSGVGLTVRGVAAAVLLGRLRPPHALAGGLVLGLVEASALSLVPGAGVEVAVLTAITVLLAAQRPDHRRAWGRAW